jgi:Cupin superfamily protein
MLIKVFPVFIATSILFYSSILLPSASALQSLVKQQPTTANPDSTRWALEHNLDPKHALTHSLFQEVALHLRSHTDCNTGSRASCPPFLMRLPANTPPLMEFNCHDLEAALNCDYLSACTGRNPDKTKKEGWRMKGLENANDKNTNTLNNVHSFQAQRLRWETVLQSPTTSIFNSAGSYISSILSATSLAALHGLHGAAVGICLNLYVTPANIRTSAPPHTDKQDVVVVQTQGRKRWRIFSPPDSSLTPELDPFTRGKGADSLTLDVLKKEGSELLLDVTLLPGDILFIPSRFPHITDTLDCYGDDKKHDNTVVFGKQDWSMHLTIGLDSHVWAMNYKSMRTLALRTHGIHDVLRPEKIKDKDDDDDDDDDDDADDAYDLAFDRNMDRCIGRVNRLSYDLREGLYSSLDDTIFSANANGRRKDQPLEQCLQLKRSMGKVASNLLTFHERTNRECGWVDNHDDGDITCNTQSTLTLDQCLATVHQFQIVGQKISNTHHNMYVAAINEEQRRENERGEWALHVGGDTTTLMEERANRLSIFRVPPYFQKLDQLRDELLVWGDFRDALGMGIREEKETELPILLEGDQVECIFPTRINANGSREITENNRWYFAKVIKVRSEPEDDNDDGFFDLQLFDGTVRKGVERNNITGPHGIGIFI